MIKYPKDNTILMKCVYLIIMHLKNKFALIHTFDWYVHCTIWIMNYRVSCFFVVIQLPFHLKMW